MIDVSLGILVSSLPWWIAAPLLQLTVLVVGMALDETYVNRTTVLMGAIAAHIHIFVVGEAGLLVTLYADVGLLVGAYGLYAYVIDGYVGTWFRLLAYYVYSPLSVFLLILAAGPTVFGVELLVPPALAVAGYANYQLRESLRPNQPFYFGPRTQEEFEAVLETGSRTRVEAETGAPGATAAAADGGNSAAAAGTATASGGTAPSSKSESGTGAGNGTQRSDDSTTATAGEQPAAEPPEQPAANSGGANAGSDEPAGADGGSEFDHPGAEPAAAADSNERGILPKFMRRL